MDKAAVHRRLREAGLPRPKADALTNLLWNVHVAGRLPEVDFARLSDAGFRHLDVCIIRELLAAALNRGRHEPPDEAIPVPVLTVLDAWGDAPDSAT
jgi:hypothetical protein